MQSASRFLVLLTVGLTAACSSAPAPIAGAPPEPPASHLGAWFWAGSATVEGYTIAADPARYRIEFVDDTTLLVQADCNRGRASYAMSAPRQFTLGPIGLTKVGCPADSQDRQFLAQLGNAGTLDAHADWLRIDAGAVSMFLARTAETPVHRFECSAGGSFAAAFAASSALVFFDRSWRILPQVSNGSGIRYSDGATNLDRKDDQAILSGSGAPRHGCRQSE